MGFWISTAVWNPARVIVYWAVWCLCRQSRGYELGLGDQMRWGELRRVGLSPSTKWNFRIWVWSRFLTQRMSGSSVHSDTIVFSPVASFSFSKSSSTTLTSSISSTSFVSFSETAWPGSVRARTPTSLGTSSTVKCDWRKDKLDDRSRHLQKTSRPRNVEVSRPCKLRARSA